MAVTHERREHRERHHKLLIENIQFDLSAQELYVENQLLDLTSQNIVFVNFGWKIRAKSFPRANLYIHAFVVMAM